MGIGSKSVVLVTAGLTVVCILAVADNFGFNPPRNVGQATLRAVDEPSTAREISPRRPQLSNHHETIAMTPLTDRLYELFPSDQKDDRHGSVQSVLSDPLSFHCLPKDVRLNDVVTYGGSQKGNVTVEKTLVTMKAQCRNSKLVDAKRREIRFFRPACWGNPPANYLEIKRRENEELQEMKWSFASPSRRGQFSN